MKLDSYCHDRLVVLRASATAYQAARAMDANHVGAVLVMDKDKVVGIVTDRDLALKVVASDAWPRRIRLESLMTRAPVALEVTDSLERAAEAMANERVRRVVLLHRGKLAGIVTLDDLILSGAMHPNRFKDVVLAQLYAPSPAKPEGLVRPGRARGRNGRARTRRAEHRAQTMRAFASRLQKLTGLADQQDALAAFDVVATAVASRLMPNEAQDFAAELPGAIREHLLARARGPDRSVTRQAISREMADRLDLNALRANELVSRVCGGMDQLISKGELSHVVGQLPRDLKPLFQHAA